jgi:hypothetical protein
MKAKWGVFSVLAALTVATLTCSRGSVVVTQELPLSPTSPPQDTPPPTHTAAPATPTEFTLPPVALSEITFTEPVTIRNVTETSATLQFELSQGAPGFLLYRARGDASLPWLWVMLNPNQKRYQLTLTDLIPNAIYDVRLGLGNDLSQIQSPSFQGENWAPVEFRTLEPGSSNFSVAVLGDSGFGDPETYQLTELIASYEPSFVVHTGDVVYDVQDNNDPIEAFELKYYAPMSAFLKRIPLYAVMGNHDVDNATFFDGSPYYLRAFSGFPDINFPSKPLDPSITWYAIARGPYQFIFLNSQAFYGQPGREEQKAFLRQRLSDGRFTHNILIFHIPPVTSGLHTTDGLPVRSDWEPIYRESTTRLVLNGHDHLYERLIFSGITHITSGGGSRVLYPVGDIAVESQVVSSRSHFVLLNFSADRIEVQAIAITGEVIDSTVIELNS